MTTRLAGRRILITGASRGVGAAVAASFAAEGAHLALTATARDHLAPVIRDIGETGREALALGVDLRDPMAIAAVARETLAGLGGLDVIVVNAGLLGYRGPLLDCPPGVWDDVLAVTVDGTFHLLRALVPEMEDGGAIILVTSGAAGRPGWGAYGVSRAALNAQAEMLRAELADRDIRVVAVNPGPARTQMRADAYPDEDPRTVPEPAELTGAFLAIAAGGDPGPFVEIPEWRARNENSAS